MDSERRRRRAGGVSSKWMCRDGRGRAVDSGRRTDVCVCGRRGGVCVACGCRSSVARALPAGRRSAAPLAGASRKRRGGRCGRRACREDASAQQPPRSLLFFYCPFGRNSVHTRSGNENERRNMTTPCASPFSRFSSLATRVSSCCSQAAPRFGVRHWSEALPSAFHGLRSPSRLDACHVLLFLGGPDQLPLLDGQEVLLHAHDAAWAAHAAPGDRLARREAECVHEPRRHVRTRASEAGGAVRGHDASGRQLAVAQPQELQQDGVRRHAAVRVLELHLSTDA